MDEQRDRQPYHPPEITRVVLRQEQAILSQCSTMAMTGRDVNNPAAQTCASSPDDCREWASSGMASDSGASPS